MVQLRVPPEQIFDFISLFTQVIIFEEIKHPTYSCMKTVILKEKLLPQDPFAQVC